MFSTFTTKEWTFVFVFALIAVITAFLATHVVTVEVSVPPPPVEVTVIHEWTIEDYNENFSMQCPFPYVVVETDEGVRHKLIGSSWGEVGETFLIPANELDP